MQQSKIEIVRDGEIITLRQYESIEIDKTLEECVSRCRILTKEIDKQSLSSLKPNERVNIYTKDENEADFVLFFTGYIKNISKTLTGRETTYSIDVVDLIEKTKQILVSESLVEEQNIVELVRRLVEKYFKDVKIGQFEPTVFTIKRVQFNFQFLYDVLMKLAESINYTFYVDLNDTFHFVPIRNRINNTVFEMDSFERGSANFSTDLSDLVNSVVVKGGLVKSEPFEEVLPDMYSLTRWTLKHKPLSTTFEEEEGVFVVQHVKYKSDPSGTWWKIAYPVGIEGLHSEDEFEYMMNYNEKLIYSTKKNAQGEYIPNIDTSGDIVGQKLSVVYAYEVPIIFKTKNLESVKEYGLYEDILDISYANDRLLARELAEEHLNIYSKPLISGSLKTWFYRDFLLGDMVRLHITTDTDFEVNDFLMLSEIKYSFTKNEVRTTLSFNDKSRLSTVIKSILDRIRDIEMSDTFDEILEDFVSLNDPVQTIETISCKTDHRPFLIRFDTEAFLNEGVS